MFVCLPWSTSLFSVDNPFIPTAITKLRCDRLQKVDCSGRHELLKGQVTCPAPAVRLVRAKKVAADGPSPVRIDQAMKSYSTQVLYAELGGMGRELSVCSSLVWARDDWHSALRFSIGARADPTAAAASRVSSAVRPSRVISTALHDVTPPQSSTTCWTRKGEVLPRL